MLNMAMIRSGQSSIMLRCLYGRMVRDFAKSSMIPLAEPSKNIRATMLALHAHVC